MQITLSTGITVRVTSDMQTTVLRAKPVSGHPRKFALTEYDSIRGVGALVRQGLVVNDPYLRQWLLTPSGSELRAKLKSILQKEGKSEAWRPGQKETIEEGGPRRVTLHPEISTAQARKLYYALEQQVRQGSAAWKGPAMPEKFLGGGVPRAIFWIVLVFMLPFVLMNSLEVFILFLVAGVGAVLWRCLRRRLFRVEMERAREQSPERILSDFRGRYVTAEMLDHVSNTLLGRTQQAVDTVLDSSLHQEGLLLDEVRNRVVLADAEWSLAQSLAQQTRTRNRIDTTPTPGQRSQEAAERARAALAEGVAEIETRIRTLEAYAGKVRAAELEKQDQRAAVEFDTITDLTRESHVAHAQQDETLSSLVQAQDIALQVEAFSSGTEDRPASTDG